MTGYLTEDFYSDWGAKALRLATKTPIIIGNPAIDNNMLIDELVTSLEELKNDIIGVNVGDISVTESLEMVLEEDEPEIDDEPEGTGDDFMALTNQEALSETSEKILTHIDHLTEDIVIDTINTPKTEITTAQAQDFATLVTDILKKSFTATLIEANRRLGIMRR